MKNQIVITDEHLLEPQKLEEALESLYTGEVQNYDVYLPKTDLPQVERIFDTIIGKHGWKNVFFKYIIRESAIPASAAY